VDQDFGLFSGEKGGKKNGKKQMTQIQTAKSEEIKDPERFRHKQTDCKPNVGQNKNLAHAHTKEHLHKRRHTVHTHDIYARSHSHRAI